MFNDREILSFYKHEAPYESGKTHTTGEKTLHCTAEVTYQTAVSRNDMLSCCKAEVTCQTAAKQK